ncbi:MAG: tetratricopeptide repeat protein [Holophagaceae bacterium]|nr:tetratricopeptide repeat protein [Holophagaceae bacterium]
MAHPDPYASYLSQARAFFEGGEVLKAGQIWQAILKKDPAHAEAKAGLYQVRMWLEAQQQAPPPPPRPTPPPVPSPPAASDPFAALAALPEPPSAPSPAPRSDPFAALPPLAHATPAPAEVPAMAPAMMPKVAPDGDLPQLHSINLESHVPSAVPKAIKRTQRSVGAMPLEPGQPEPLEEAAETEAAAPALPLPDEDEVERYIREGCTLYDMGEVRGAIQKWEAVLARQPSHANALAYLNEARRDLGLAPLQGPESAPPSWSSQAPAVREDADQLLREAVQLEEMGLPEEAIAKLRRVLEIDPDHRDAKAYLEMNARTQGAVPMVAPPPPPVPAPAPPPKPEAPENFQDFTPSTLPPLPVQEPEPPPVPSLPTPTAPAAPVRRMDPAVAEQKLRQGERLLQIKHYEEALFAFQMVLMQDPDNARAKGGLEQAQAALAPAAPQAPPTRSAGVAEAVSASSAPRPLTAVQPPTAVTSAAPALRNGPEVATMLKDRAWWNRNPLILGAAAGFLLGSLLAWWQVRQKDARLQDAIQAARTAAMTPRNQSGRPVDLKETSASVRSETESILREDPVRAYHRALFLLKLDPADAAGAQYLERAKAAMATPPPATAAELQSQLQTGDLEAAVQTVNKLLQANPEEPALMARAARLNAALAQSHASRENWTEAREALRRCRALFPQDHAWQAKLKLLDTLQTLPKGDRAAWISMLG